MTTATILPSARSVFVDANGVPLVGGKIYTYIPTTTTPKTTWQNAGQTIANSNPIILDGDGSCLFYGSGQYTMTLEDVNGNIIWTGLTQDLLSLTSALLNYTPPGTGSVTTTVQKELALGYLHLLDFGAVGNGTTDDTAAIQAWVNACASTGLTGWFDPAPSRGGYLTSSQISYTGSNPLSITGPGYLFGSYLKLSSATQNGFYLDTTGSGRFYLSGFGVISGTTPTAGAGIFIDGTTSSVVQCTFDNLVLGVNGQGGGALYNGYYSTGCSGPTVTRCTFNASNYCFYSQDIGDSYLAANIFSPVTSSGYGMFLTGDPGGVRIISNKFVSGVAYLAAIFVEVGANDGDFISVGNSLENFTSYGIYLLQASAPILFGNIIINANEFAGNGSGSRAVTIPSTTSNWLNSVVVTSNTMSGAQHGVLVNATEYLIISNNACFDIDIGSQANTGQVTDNVISSGGNISNSSTSVIVTNNPGYNPVGASALSPGSSPWTYTASASPEVLCVSASTSITALTINGTAWLSHATVTNSPISVPLPPFGVAVITYTGTLLGNKMIY